MKIVTKLSNNKLLIEHKNRRVIIPHFEYVNYENGNTDPDILVSMGVPVSVEWADFLEGVCLDGEAIMNALHQNGIHTVEDLLHNQAKFTGAVMSALVVTAGSLAKRAKGGF